MRRTRNDSRPCRAVVPSTRPPSRQAGSGASVLAAVALSLAAIFGVAGGAAASALVLSDRQLDHVTAGGMPVVTMNGTNAEVVMDIRGDITWAVIGVGDGHSLTIQNPQRMIVLSGASATSFTDGIRIESSSYAMASTRNGTASASTSSSADTHSAQSSGSAEATGSGDNQAHSISFTSAMTDQGAATARTVSFGSSRGGTARASSSGEVRSDDSVIYAPFVGTGATLGAFALGDASGYSFAEGRFSGSLGYINTSSSTMALGGSTLVVSGPLN